MHIKLFEDENTIDLNKMFDEINSKHFNNRITKIPCEWNNKLRTCAGKCFYIKRSKIGIKITKDYTPSRIELSKKLFENNNMDMKKIERTLIHEMTHAFLLEVYNEPGHTNRFQQIMTRITGEDVNHRCHSYDVTGLKNKRNVYYVCECGLTDGWRSRMPKAGSTYTARCCKGKVSFSRVEYPKEASAASNRKKDDGNDFISLF